MACVASAIAIATGHPPPSALDAAGLVGDDLHIGIPFSAFFTPGVAPQQNSISVDRQLVQVRMDTDDDAPPPPSLSTGRLVVAE